MGYAACPAFPLALVRECAPEYVDARDPSDADALEDLGDEIATLAAHIHAATHRLLELIADFDRREGWALDGHRSCAHWLAFRTGIDLGAAREKVRTARALRELPKTSAAMAHGELSFSQVRALTRVADPGSEADLLELARGSTTAQLERVVRSWKRGSRQDEEELERARHESRTLSIFPDDDGMYVVRGKLPPELGVLLMRAVEAASDALHGARTEAERAMEGPSRRRSAGRGPSVTRSCCTSTRTRSERTGSPVAPSSRTAHAFQLKRPGACAATLRWSGSPTPPTAPCWTSAAERAPSRRRCAVRSRFATGAAVFPAAVCASRRAITCGTGPTGVRPAWRMLWKPPELPDDVVGALRETHRLRGVEPEWHTAGARWKRLEDVPDQVLSGRGGARVSSTPDRRPRPIDAN